MPGVHTYLRPEAARQAREQELILSLGKLSPENVHKAGQRGLSLFQMPVKAEVLPSLFPW